MRVDARGASPIFGSLERLGLSSPAPAVATARAPASVLEVTIDGATQRFEAGSARNAMVGRLDSVQGLTSRIADDGRLQFVTDDARQMLIAEIAVDEPGYAEAVLDSLFAALDIR